MHATVLQNQGTELGISAVPVQPYAVIYDMAWHGITWHGME